MKSYRVEIWDKTFSERLTVVPFPQVKSYSLTLNKSGKALFEIEKNIDITTSENLATYNGIKLLRWSDEAADHVAVWSGYIDGVREQASTFEVGCVGSLDLLDKRLTGSDEHLSGQAGTEILDLLTAANVDENTGIIVGSTDVTDSINLTFNKSTLLAAIRSVATKVECEFEIDPETLEFNFLSTIGEDKTATVVFIRDDENPNATNVADAKLEKSGADIYNYIIAHAKNGSTHYNSIQSDATSIATHGRLEKAVSFDEARSQLELDSLAAGYLAAHKDEIVNIVIEPAPRETVTAINGDQTTKGYDFYDDYALGDLITVKYRTAFEDISQTQRIVEIAVSIDASGDERIRLKTNTEDQDAIASIIERTKQENIEKRLTQIENEIYA